VAIHRGDIKEMKLNLDQFQSRQASKSLEDANEALRRMIRETYKWMVAPMQEARPWQGAVRDSVGALPGQPGRTEPVAGNRARAEGERTPDHRVGPDPLGHGAEDWFWKDDIKDTSALNVWQQSCQQLYLPRLKDDTAFQHTLGAGAESRDFFGFAQGKEDGRYVGFTFGKRTSLFLDSSLLLIEPVTAAGYAESAARSRRGCAAQADRPAPAPPAAVHLRHGSRIQPSRPIDGWRQCPADAKKQFYGSIELDAIQAKKQFADLVDEVVQQFTIRPGVKVKIAIEIQAESAGFRRWIAARREGELQRAAVQEC
jgi:hypothetical protein